MTSFLLLFLLFLVASTACRLWLNLRQTRAVRQHRDQVPPPFDTSITLEDHRKAADYTVAKAAIGRVDILVDTALLLVWTVGGALALLDGLWRGVELGPVTTGAGYLVSMFFAAALISLPLDIYRTFVIEERFGFNRTTVRLYITDLVRSTLLGLALGLPLIAAILWIMGRAGPLWWLYAWLVWAAFSLLLSWAYPALIAPLFNKFTPLADSSVEERIRALLERCGFRSKGIFVMDGSRRSAHGNAYFTGLGNNKRIVFFDTLLEHLDIDEVEAVLAHELGHFRKRHVRKRIAIMLLSGLAGLAILGWLKQQQWFYGAFGIAEASDYVALALFFLVTPVFTYFLTPLLSSFSRRHEFEADAYAAVQCEARHLVSALVKLYRDNASTLTPDPLHSVFYDSHPPASIRIAHLQSATGP